MPLTQPVPEFATTIDYAKTKLRSELSIEVTH
jgi:hypothetical protein